MAHANVARRHRARASLRRGAAAAEFVITLPVLVLLLLGTIEYGNFFAELSMVTNAARGGARYGGMQESYEAARIQGALATRQLLTDMGYPCDMGGDVCIVTTEIVQQTAVDVLEISVEVQYNQVTGAVPHSSFIPAIPSALKAKGTYPLVNN